MRQAQGAMWFFILVAALSCAGRSFESQAYKSLTLSKAAFEEITDLAIERYEAGELSTAQFRRLSSVARRWGRAHNAALDSLALYLDSRSEGDRLAYEERYRLVEQLLTELETVLDSLGILGKDQVR